MRATPCSPNVHVRMWWSGFFSAKRPSQRVMTTIIGRLDGKDECDPDSWRKWHEKGLDFFGYAWATPPDFHPHPSYQRDLDIVPGIQDNRMNAGCAISKPDARIAAPPPRHAVRTGRYGRHTACRAGSSGLIGSRRVYRLIVSESSAWIRPGDSDHSGFSRDS